MNIFDKMQLLKLLRDYRASVLEGQSSGEKWNKSRPIRETELQVEQSIREWMDTRGEF